MRLTRFESNKRSPNPRRGLRPYYRVSERGSSRAAPAQSAALPSIDAHPWQKPRESRRKARHFPGMDSSMERARRAASWNRSLIGFESTHRQNRINFTRFRCCS
jgi:hypothetical protein